MHTYIYTHRSIACAQLGKTYYVDELSASNIKKLLDKPLKFEIKAKQ